MSVLIARVCVLDARGNSRMEETPLILPDEGLGSEAETFVTRLEPGERVVERSVRLA